MEKETYTAAMDYALYLLGLCARTVAEVKKRLKKRGFEESVIDQVLTRLQELGYLNDQAYVENYLKTRYQATGRRRLEHELVQKGVALDTVRQGIEDNVNEEQELSHARRLAAKQWCTAGQKKDFGPEVQGKVLRKIASRLLYRGFSYEIVTKVISEIRCPANDI